MNSLYPNGVKLQMRQDGWLDSGSCSVKFIGTEGWVETGDSGKFGVSSPALLASGVSGELPGHGGVFGREGKPSAFFLFPSSAPGC